MDCRWAPPRPVEHEKPHGIHSRTSISDHVGTGGFLCIDNKLHYDVANSQKVVTYLQTHSSEAAMNRRGHSWVHVHYERTELLYFPVFAPS